MYSLYIDESGDPELSSNTESVVLCGVLIHSREEAGLNFILERIKRKYNLDHGRHLHAVEVFERSKSPAYLGITGKRTKSDLRKEFQAEVWQAIKDFEVKYMTVAVRKDEVKKVLGFSKLPDKGKMWVSSSNFYARIDRQLPMDIGANAIYNWALRQLKPEEKLRIIFESREMDIFTGRNFRYLTHREVHKSLPMKRFSQNFKEKAVSITFANKFALNVGLELADFIAYTCNHYFMLKGNAEVKKVIRFPGINKILNKKHFAVLSKTLTRSYSPGLTSRTKRIAEGYAKHYWRFSGSR